MNSRQVSLVRCASYDTAQVEAAVKNAVGLLGGMRKFIQPGEKVLLKPNLLTAVAPEKGVVTHPEVVRAVIRLIKPITAHIFCGDSPGVLGGKKDIDRVYEVSGVKKVCQEEGVALVFFTEAKIVRGYPLASLAFTCDKLINIPKFKTHGFTVLTACLKNLFGLIIGLHKIKIHHDHPDPEGLSKVIVDIYQIRKPDLNIVDGIIAMEGQGPGSSGKLKKMGLIAASADGLCLDVTLSGLMKCNARDIPTNREALERGLGPADEGSIEILGGRVEDFTARDFQLPAASVLSKLPKWAVRLMVSFLKVEPVIVGARCKLCGACCKICPVQALSESQGRLVLDRSKCILCLCCQEICPHGAVDIKKGVLVKLLAR
jgi:uncharacterized protein (DUF362 family)/NAD-dependent dihydropyrimidine dehydrogenase PreA subunit